MERGKFIIINYDILKNFHSFKDDSIRTLLDSGIERIIIDENTIYLILKHKELK